jgi:hypothetical protein
MAVFPSRIRLKNSTDSSAAITTAIASGGSDAIVAGELVIGRSSGSAALFTLDSAGSVVQVGSSIVGSRSTIIATTTSIANGASTNLLISGTGRSGLLLSIETDRAAWVVVYSSTSARTADASRAETTDPTLGSGVLAEVITTGAQVIKITPSASYFNDETVTASSLYLKVTNKSGSTATVQVQLKVVPAEA